MADTLYLSLWFPSFTETEMLPRTLSVLRQCAFSEKLPGVSYVAVHPVSWNEATVFERRYQPGIAPEAAVEAVQEFVHEDYAYVFEVSWDLWSPAEEVPGEEDEAWTMQPSLVRVIAHGSEFDERTAEHEGQVQIDFGLDTPFLYEDVQLTPATEQRVKANVHKLVAFTSAVEKNTGISGRVLWSESEENLAQKLIARLQKIQ